MFTEVTCDGNDVLLVTVDLSPGLTIDLIDVTKWVYTISESVG